MLRDLSALTYVPLLAVRPAEMNALEELPEKSKDAILPFVFLRPWVAAQQFDAVLSRIEKAYGDRPWIADVSESIVPDGPARPVHERLSELRNPHNGYERWCEFVADQPSIIPVVQLETIDELEHQVSALGALNRGIVVRLKEPTFGLLEEIVAAFGALVAPEELMFVIDFAQRSHEILLRAAAAAGMVQTIEDTLPGAHVCLSATTFPDGFAGLVSQDIYEREFFSAVSELRPDSNLIYSDRGSARAEPMGGGGGLPTPRIDYPLPQEWHFFREEVEYEGEEDDQAARQSAYRAAATAAMASPGWDSDLHVWGVQMIERTAFGDPGGISSPARSTSARINIHLHRQIYFDDPSAGYDTDEDWSD